MAMPRSTFAALLAGAGLFDDAVFLAFVLALLDLVVAGFLAVAVLAGVAFFVVVAFLAVVVLAGVAFLAVVVFFAVAVGWAGAAGAGAGVAAGRAFPREVPVRAVAMVGAPASGDGAWACAAGAPANPRPAQIATARMGARHIRL
jgi:hypothetical protein